MTLGLTSITAQVQPDAFQVYVDPNNGDDALAMAQNPDGAGNGWPLDLHIQGQILGRLTHAPYSFRTVTQAFAWINTMFPQLPWSHAVATDEQVHWVIVQCLPGMYGPFSEPTLPRLDAASGLFYNGETFPLSIPERVSIQGVSALDTVFDARGLAVSVLRVSSGTTSGPTHAHTFIDSVAIRGATGGYPSGAGIVIDGKTPQSPIVSNCCIYYNAIGIGVVSELVVVGEPPKTVRIEHNPHIVNNTIAFNGTGLWNGELTLTRPGTGGTGWSLVNTINNVFDTRPPSGASLVAFQGMTAADMTVFGGVNANGYPSSRANVGGGPAGWGTPVPRGPAPPLPVVDLNAYLYGPSGARGNLYLSDILRNSPGAVPSPHDFRLAPIASRDPDLPNSSSGPNPLVNVGVSSSTTLTMGNGTALHVGLLYDPVDVATYSAWDWDTEGYGNPRIASRSGGYPAGTIIDLGADEMGELIMGGFAENTRIFSRTTASHLGPTGDHTTIWFFNVPGTYPRPVCNLLIGRSTDLLGSPPQTVPDVNNAWYAQARANPNPPVGLPTSNYTDGAPPNSATGDQSFRYLVRSSAPPVPWTVGSFNVPFMRNLECDFAPSLLPDIHGFWSLIFWNASEAGIR
jgi:hypothetical protein